MTGSLSSRSNYQIDNANKCLVIRRLIRQPNGEKTWNEEVVRDQVVIKSYLRQRQMIEEEATRYLFKVHAVESRLLTCPVLVPKRLNQQVTQKRMLA